jgi:hypothetical protein
MAITPRNKWSTDSMMSESEWWQDNPERLRKEAEFAAAHGGMSARDIAEYLRIKDLEDTPEAPEAPEAPAVPGGPVYAPPIVSPEAQRVYQQAQGAVPGLPPVSPTPAPPSVLPPTAAPGVSQGAEMDELIKSVVPGYTGMPATRTGLGFVGPRNLSPDVTKLTPEQKALKARGKAWEAGQGVLDVKTDPDTGVKYFTEKGRIRLIPYKAPAEDELDLTPAGVESAARTYAMTGNMPPLGMGKSKLRAQIINAAAKYDAKGDMYATRAEYKAQSSALRKLTEASTQQTAFLEKAKNQADILFTVMDRIPGIESTGVKMVNALAQAVDKKIIGTGELAQYNLALETFAREYNRVTTASANMTGQIHQEAMKNMVDLMSGALPPKALKATIELAKKDMEASIKAYNDEIESVKSAIGGMAEEAKRPKAAIAAPIEGKTPPKVALKTGEKLQYSEKLKKWSILDTKTGKRRVL